MSALIVTCVLCVLAVFLVGSCVGLAAAVEWSDELRRSRGRTDRNFDDDVS